MPICHKRQFIFFHIPRCAGTSLEVFFNFRSHEKLFGVINRGGQVLTLHHMTAPDLLAHGLVSDEDMRSYFKFTVIRDPFDRMASDYLWQKKRDKHREFAGLDFPAYLEAAERIVREERYFEKVHYDHFRPMLDYCVHNGKLLVDKILMLDDIHRELASLEDKLGPIDLPHFNHMGDYSELRTRENLERVDAIYQCDRVLYENRNVIMADG